MPILFELPYNPPIAFFSELVGADSLLVESHENYRKQTYRNRCLILTAQGIKPLTVPVIDGNRSEKVKTAAIEIDYRQNWVHQHWRTLQTAYGSSPYFEYYADYLHDIYVQKPRLLFDLNLNLLHFYLRCLRLRTPLVSTSEYHSFYSDPTVRDRRDWLTPKAPAHSEPDTPSDQGRVRPYSQAFGLQFVPHLSILDLLFSQGPNAGSYLA
jgi:hypothetical protein